MQIVSNTIQEYGGVRYYKCGSYFQNRGKRLHVKNWEEHFGEVPKDYHVHHIDGDKSNNNINNLEALKGSDHLSQHAKQRVEYNLKHIAEIRPLASLWHGSEEGFAFHSKLAKETWKKREEINYKCDNCNSEFKTKRMYGERENKFCSNKCKATFRRKSGVDNEARTCVKCGCGFISNKYSTKRFCSKECRL